MTVLLTALMKSPSNSAMTKDEELEFHVTKIFDDRFQLSIKSQNEWVYTTSGFLMDILMELHVFDIYANKPYWIEVESLNN